MRVEVAVEGVGGVGEMGLEGELLPAFTLKMIKMMSECCIGYISLPPLLFS